MSDFDDMPGLHTFVTFAAVLALLLGGLYWARDDIAAWVRAWGLAPVEKQASLRCPIPSEFETLVVTVNTDLQESAAPTDRVRLRVRCDLAGGAGAYRRQR